MPVPNSFANVTTSIPLSQLDANFNTPITLGNTAIQLGNTVTTLNNMTLANVTVSSGNVTITNVSVTTANVTTANIATSNVTTSQILNYGTANGVAYLNTSKALTTGAALVFDGDTFSVSGTATLTGSFNSTSANGTAIRLQNSSNNVFYMGSSKYLTGTGSASEYGIGTTGATPVLFITNGSERMRIDSSGNLGLGVTPSAWSGFTALQIQNGALFTDSTSFRSIMNGYYNGTNWIYSTSNAATRYEQLNGIHRWFNAASGTAGAQITFTQAMTLDAIGRLGIGTTTPGVGLQVTGNALNLVGSTHWYNYIGNGSSSGQGILTGYFTGTGVGGMIAGDAAGGVVNNLTFCGYNGSSWNELMRLRGDGNFLVGTTTSHAKLTVQGQLAVGQTTAASNASGLYIYASNALSDNSYLSRGSAGTGTTTWYIGNQTITTSSDERLKANIAPTERNALELLQQWEIVDHTWNDPSDQCENNRNSRGVWTGVVAQQVQPITPWLVNKPLEEINEDGSINPWTMDFGYAVPLLVKAIQEQQAMIDEMKAEIAALKGAA